MKHTLTQRSSREKPDDNQAIILPGDVLAVACHKMRPPLTAMRGYTTTLLRHASRLPLEEQHEFLSTILAAGERLEHIVDRLIELIQLEATSELVMANPINVKHLVGEAIIALPMERRMTPLGEERIDRAGEFGNEEVRDRCCRA